MSVLSPVIDRLDLSTKHIYLLAGTREYHPVSDIYVEVRNIRRLDESMRVFDMPVTAFGAVPKGGGKYTSRYTRFNHGWTVVPEDITHSLYVTGEQITDDGQSGPACIDTSTLSAGTSVIIQYEPPASELVKAEDELIAIQRMAFDEVISVNVESGTAGTEWPTGTLGQPVDNLADALLISAQNDIYTLSLLVDTYVDSGGDYRGITFIGASKTKTEITVSDAAQVNNCEFYDAHVKGILDGDSTLHSCVIDDLNYVTGFIEQCVLDAGTVLLGAGATAHFLDCWSGVPGTATPTINMGGSGQALAMRNYNGGIAIVNKTGIESVSLDLNSGQVKIDLATVTNGTIVVRGIGKVVEMTTGTDLPTGYYDSLYILNEAMNRDNISSAVWDEPIADHLIAGSTGLSVGVTQFAGVVTVSASGASGTTFPLGTARSPVNNMADAVVVAANNGIDKFHFVTNFTITGGSYTGYVFTGNGRRTPYLTFDGTLLTGCQFKEIELTGAVAAGSVLGANFCTFDEFSGARITAYECVFEGDIALGSGESNFYSCVDGVPGIGIPDIQVGPCNSLGIWDWNGGIRLSTISTPDTAITCMITAGRLWVDETCVEGDIIVKGMADLRGETGGTTIDKDGLVTKDTFAEAILDATITDHQDEATVGNIFMQIAYGGSVFFDSSSGISGDMYPVGTSGSPVNNIADALVIAQSYKCKTIHLHSDVDLTDIDISELSIEGHTQQQTVTCFNTGTSEASFKDVKLTGVIIGRATFYGCHITNLSGVAGFLDECQLEGTISLSDATSNETLMHQCSAVDLAGPIIDTGTESLIATQMSGRVTIAHVTSGTVGIGGDFCQVVLDETCTGGVAAIGTKGSIINNSQGTVVALENALTTDTIAEGVWSYERV